MSQSIENLIINDADYVGKDVASVPDKLEGTAAQNKAVFDNLIKSLIAVHFNALIRRVVSIYGASDVGVTSVGVQDPKHPDIMAANTQEALNKLKKYIDDIADGFLSGEMQKQIYDPQDRATDIFAITDAIEVLAREALGIANESYHPTGFTDAQINQAIALVRVGFALAREVTLPPTGWTNGTITIPLTDIRASGQVVFPSPAPGFANAWADAGIECIAQGEGTLTFAREKANENAIPVNVAIVLNVQ